MYEFAGNEKHDIQLREAYDMHIMRDIAIYDMRYMQLSSLHHTQDNTCIVS